RAGSRESRLRPARGPVRRHRRRSLPTSRRASSAPTHSSITPSSSSRAGRSSRRSSRAARGDSPGDTGRQGMLRPAGAAPRILTVTQVATLVRERLEGGIGAVWVGGDISNLRPQASGHVYFTLKDEESQLAAVMFRSAAQVLAFRPADGMDVLVRARVGI